KDAEQFGLSNGDRVNVKFAGPRALIFAEVLVRVSDDYYLEMHIDIDEGNAAGIKNGDYLDLLF
ncbi:MAG: PduL/EutD family phosphate acyltransferase, partial [Bacillota bacterium]|nr:PduL/EutD family phosphate acyltransferase [Bacillota bacterium]